ncbi:MAG: tetratricopeptide repeat protein [Candidatus Thorarchaeota archaeon]
MYKEFDLDERVFVDREEYIKWMKDALDRCKEKPVALHLKGIGGIGKSSLLEHWMITNERTVKLDCDQFTEFYQRLNMLAKGSVLTGVNVPRFDILWQIRQRFVEGVEPVKEEGREWAKDVVTAIPFIGSLAQIGNAIRLVGKQVTPKLKGKYSVVGKWLEERLGKAHVERLLEILWKEPRHAEILFLDALLGDINSRKILENPILFLIDHFEYVDREKTQWSHKGERIAETDLWRIFLTSLKNCVGVMASRSSLSSKTKLKIEESELTELDRENALEMLELQGVKDNELQERIVSVSGGNPFVIDAICDITNSSELSIDEIEDLRAGTLEEVRVKTWRKLFSDAKDLFNFVDRAGVLPYFTREVMSIVAPQMKTDEWNRLLKLSFVKDRGDGTYVLHDLAEELVRAELGDRLKNLTDEVVGLLETESLNKDDLVLYGLAISVQGLSSPGTAVEKLGIKWVDLFSQPRYTEALEMLDIVNIETDAGWLEKQTIKGYILSWSSRYPEAEEVIVEALDKVEKFTDEKKEEYCVYVARVLHIRALLYLMTNRPLEYEETSKKSITIFSNQQSKLKAEGLSLDYISLYWYWDALRKLGSFLANRYRLGEAVDLLQSALSLCDDFPESGYLHSRDVFKSAILSRLGGFQYLSGQWQDALETTRESIELTTDDAFKANTTMQHATYLLLLNHDKEAEEMMIGVIEYARGYYEKDPELVAVWYGLYNYLTNLADLYRVTDRYDKAEEILDESNALVRKHASETTSTQDTLSWQLSKYAILQRVTGRLAEAENNWNEAIEIYRKYVERDPVGLRFLANFINSQAILLRQIEKLSEAEKLYVESIEIINKLATEYPEVVFYPARIGLFKTNLGVLLKQTNRLSEAEEVYLEALQIWNDLSKRAPGIFNVRKASTLNNLGVLQLETESFEEAEDSFKESITLRRELFSQSRALHQSSLASVLNNMGILLYKTDRMSKAEDTLQESVEIYEELYNKAPVVYLSKLANTLCNLSVILLERKQSTEKIDKRLKELGIDEIPKEVRCIEEESDYEY